jgi:hypothetical protein
MNREQGLLIWAPKLSPWGAWTKPVLFSFMSDPLPQQVALTDTRSKFVASRETAILVELPGTETVVTGLQLASSGYQPIPLFNASPYALDSSSFGTGELPALVDVMSIMRALERYTEYLNSMNLPDSAPPAFLLDANRSKGPLFPPAEVFDNRSIVRASDLPSGELLNQAGIRRVILLRTTDRLSRDLHPIVWSWHNFGLQIQIQHYAEEWDPQDYQIEHRNMFVVLFEKVLMWVSFRTNSIGSFGRTIHSAGG